MQNQSLWHYRVYMHFLATLNKIHSYSGLYLLQWILEPISSYWQKMCWQKIYRFLGKRNSCVYFSTCKKKNSFSVTLCLCPSQFLDQWESAELLFCSEELSFLDYIKKPNLSSGRENSNFAVCWKLNIRKLHSTRPHSLYYFKAVCFKNTYYENWYNHDWPQLYWR